MEDEYSPFRRKSPLREIFARRGHFSLHRGNCERSEIPENTFDTDPRSVLGSRSKSGCSCCRSRGRGRKHHDCLTLVSAIVTITVFVLLFASLVYHLFFLSGRVRRNKNGTLIIEPMGIYNASNFFIQENTSVHENVGEILAPLSPLGMDSQFENVPVEVLEDFVNNVRPSSTKFLTHELTKVVRRYRRTVSRLNESHNTGNNLAKATCIGDECNEIVDAAQKQKKLREILQSKLDEILDNIRQVKDKFKAYEEHVRKNSNSPFHDYNGVKIESMWPVESYFYPPELEGSTQQHTDKIQHSKNFSLEELDYSNKGYTSSYESSESMQLFHETGSSTQLTTDTGLPTGTGEENISLEEFDYSTKDYKSSSDFYEATQLFQVTKSSADLYTNTMEPIVSDTKISLEEFDYSTKSYSSGYESNEVTNLSQEVKSPETHSKGSTVKPATDITDSYSTDINVSLSETAGVTSVFEHNDRVYSVSSTTESVNFQTTIDPEILKSTETSSSSEFTETNLNSELSDFSSTLSYSSTYSAIPDPTDSHQNFTESDSSSVNFQSTRPFENFNESSSTTTFNLSTINSSVLSTINDNISSMLISGTTEIPLEDGKELNKLVTTGSNSLFSTIDDFSLPVSTVIPVSEVNLNSSQTQLNLTTKLPFDAHEEVIEGSMETNIRTVTETTVTQTIPGLSSSEREVSYTLNVVTTDDLGGITERVRLEEMSELTSSRKEMPSLTATTANNESEDTTYKTTDSGVPGLEKSDLLEKEVFAHNEDPKWMATPPTPTENLVIGISLEEAKLRRKMHEHRKKWDSRVVGSSDDVTVPTGPDTSSAMGESSSSGQQISYGPSAFSPVAPMMIPYQVCFFGSPNHNFKGMPAIRKDNEARTLNLQYPFYHPFPAVKISTSTVAPISGKPMPLQNVFNIVMNNYPTHVTAPGGLMPGPPHLMAPEIFPSPYQQQVARYISAQQAPLFCSALQAPLLQFPTVPGTTEYGHAKCLNCEGSEILQSRRGDDDVFEGPSSCPEGTTACRDKQLCIPSEQWCDGHAHCIDGSDELFCSCRDRIMPARICDGYPDCPHGEDETGCYDCLPGEFSCGGSDQDGSCIPLSKRCDGNRDCVLGIDEEGCSILTSSPQNISHPVPYSEGFLLKNWRGTWYPVCKEKGRQSWAEKACAESTGSDPGDIDVDTIDLHENVVGPFLVHLEDENFFMKHHCKGHQAVYVRCPTLRCGTRIDGNDEQSAKNQFASRFRRLVEHHDSPTYADQPFMLWWEQVLEDVQKKFNVRDVTARLVPLPSEEGNFGDRMKREGTERVVGGRQSEPNSWPWAVALFRDGYFHCGGVVLDKDWIMTAAHCVIDFWRHYFEVRVGMLRRKSFSVLEQIRRVSNIVVHENYDTITMKNDIAVLRLAQPLSFGRWVRPICLPYQENDSKGPVGPPPGSYCIAIGWGALKERGRDPDQLREVDVPIAASCKHREDIEGLEICAGYHEGGKDTCQGDSGGPLMCRDSSSAGAWYVAGIVSHGEGCARPDEPGAYTRVSLFVDWLAKNTGGNLPRDVPLQHCPGFKCHSHPGLCLPKNLHCNGKADCFGGEDEIDCKRYRNDDDEDGERPINDPDKTPVLQMKLDDIRQDYDFFNYTTNPHLDSTFECKSMTQRIAGTMRCDGIQDCEDASDEWNCTCRDRFLREHPLAVCDGITDCSDLSDEKNCYECPEDFFNCRRSQQCLHLDRRCDFIADCTLKEDETDCLTLSKDLKLIIEENGQPSYEPEGALMENFKGVWRLVCFNKTQAAKSRYSKKICHDLGLIGYEDFNAYGLDDITVDIQDYSFGFLTKTSFEKQPKCTALDVKCSERTSTEKSHFNRKSWTANIRVNGFVNCSAVLLTSDWLLASSKCFPNQHSLEYMAAELGITFYPPTFIRIDDLRLVPNTDIALLHLEQPIIPSRYLRPIQVPYLTDVEDLKHCQAITGNQSIELRISDKDCERGHVCFSRVKRPIKGCTPTTWVGFVVCSSKIGGWVPVSVFEENGGSCGFQNSEFTNIMNHLEAITHTMDVPVNGSNDPICNGMRCIGGLCVSSKHVCDGIPNCPYGDDEVDLQCSAKNYTTDCRRDELRCANEKCVPRSQFADNSSQCEDGSDEPENVTCASYLHLTEPLRICDGIRNCLDKTDEDPDICGCLNHTKKCARSQKCISTEFVCDGQKDCPNGDDEDHCLGLQRVPRISNNYMLVERSYGAWHTACGANLTLSDADELCQRYSHRNVVSMTTKKVLPTFAELDTFTSVRLNDLTKLHLRGNRPLVTLRKGIRTCTGVFLTCL